MSDNTQSDPMNELLTERKRELEQVRDDATARLEEINLLLGKIADGRTRVRRRLREAVVPGNGASEQAAEAAG
jgi:hypothetical protein